MWIACRVGKQLIKSQAICRWNRHTNGSKDRRDQSHFQSHPPKTVWALSTQYSHWQLIRARFHFVPLFLIVYWFGHRLHVAQSIWGEHESGYSQITTIWNRQVYGTVPNWVSLDSTEWRASKLTEGKPLIKDPVTFPRPMAPYPDGHGYEIAVTPLQLLNFTTRLLTTEEFS